jgi:hypothetical protein
MVSWKSLALYAPAAKQPRPYRKMLKRRLMHDGSVGKYHDGKYHSYECPHSATGSSRCSECGAGLGGYRADARLCSSARCRKAAYRKRKRAREASQ